jgi:hypothetical protein
MINTAQRTMVYTNVKILYMFQRLSKLFMFSLIVCVHFFTSWMYYGLSTLYIRNEFRDLVYSRTVHV